MTQELPFFSIIVPTHNRPERLSGCLQSQTLLDYPAERFEVIVVDDGSVPSLDPIVHSFNERLNVRLISQPNAGPASARNMGASHARGSFLAFTDDDCAPSSDWLRKLAARFSEKPDSLIGGRTLNGLSDNPFSSASQILLDYLHGYYNSDCAQARFLTSNNLAVSAEGFRATGGFDRTFVRAAAEDREFCDRWLRHGGSMTYAPEVVVHHAHTLNLLTFCRQHFNYGRGAFHFHQVRARDCKEPIKLEPQSFYLNLLLYPFSQRTHSRASLLALLMAMSQGANAAGFFYEKAIS